MSEIYQMFKAYDLRGTVPSLTQAIYYWTGFALVEKILKPEKLPLIVNLTHDCRYSSPGFYKAFYHGVAAAGGMPRALGLASTDILYASCQLFANPGSIVTASHNPKDDNGLKTVKTVPEMLGLSSGLDQIRDFVTWKVENEKEQSEKLDFNQMIEPVCDLEAREKTLNFFKNKIKELGSTEQINTFLTEFLAKNKRKYKVVVDCGNGMGGLVMGLIQDLYPQIEWVRLYWEPDGTFPNHPADPSSFANMLDLQQAVLREKADLGAAFDGDADRCYFLDQEGNSIDGNYLVAVLAKYFLEEITNYPDKYKQFRQSVVYPLAASTCIPDTVLASGGGAIPSKMGHTFIKKNMYTYACLYGGEHSGHHYYGQFGYMDSGALTLVTVLKILLSAQLPASLLTRHLAKKYHLSGEINFHLRPDLTIDFIKNKLNSAYPEAMFSYLDGISLFFPDWKVNLRFSNTEPLLRLNLEVTGLGLSVEEKQQEIKDLLNIN